MTQPTASPLAQHEQQLRDTITGWRATTAQIRQAVADDRRIASTAAREVTQERVDAIRPRWAAVVDDIAGRADTVVDQLGQQLGALLPPRDDSLEGMFDRQARWSRWSRFLAARPDARPVDIVNAATTVEDVYTLLAELPMWYMTSGFDDTITETIADLCITRLAVITGPEAAAALAVADAAVIARTRMEPLIDQARAEIGGQADSGSMLHSALTGWAASTAQSRRYAGLPLA